MEHKSLLLCAQLLVVEHVLIVFKLMTRELLIENRFNDYYICKETLTTITYKEKVNNKLTVIKIFIIYEYCLVQECLV